MAKIPFTPELKKQYQELFTTCQIRSEKVAAVELAIAQILFNQARYRTVAESLDIPWYFVAVVHNLEASLSFSRHLHNGDPLNARTVHVPAGQPRNGEPPFSWEESAIDALTLRGLVGKIDWSLAGTLYQLEGYNGWGYRQYHSYVPSPYLWSGSLHYHSGKYVADGTWSHTAVSCQIGSAVLLRRMAEQGQIRFTVQIEPTDATKPLLVNYALTRSSDAAEESKAEQLQRWLNTFSAIYLKVDGVPGWRTASAYEQVTGACLPDAPRR